MYDTKGRFAIHRISAEEAEYKLCKVKKVQLGDRGIPYIVTHDGRTIRYPDPAIKVNDSVKLDLNENKIVDFLKFEVGQTVMATGGRNMGRAGTIVHRERHPGGFDMSASVPSSPLALTQLAHRLLCRTHSQDPRPS